MHKSATTVVIPNWNGIDLIRDCLLSLASQTLNHSVIVVDNGSVDGSNIAVSDEFPEVQLLEFPNNAGFAGGVNRGIRPALDQGAKYVVLLNNDAVADEHWLEHLVALAEKHPNVGIVTSKIRHYAEPLLDSTGDFYSTWALPFPRGRDEIDTGQYDDTKHQIIFGASGGASLYRTDMLRQIGLFDERFFAYFEDVDISFRAQLAGWKVRYESKAVVRHHIGGTSSKHPGFGRYHTVKNFHYIYTKDMPAILYWKYLPKYWLMTGLMFGSDLRRGLVKENLRANLEALRQLPSVLRDRKKIQSTRRVSTAYIDSILYHKLPPTQRTFAGLRRRLLGR